MNPENYTYYRRNKVDEDRGDKVPPTILTYAEVRPLISSINKVPARLFNRLMKGEKIVTRFGTYWAKEK